MLTFLYYNHLLLYHGTGSIRGVQQAPRIRMYWRVGALKELVESEAAATARHFNREFTTGFLGPPPWKLSLILEHSLSYAPLIYDTVTCADIQHKPWCLLLSTDFICCPGYSKAVLFEAFADWMFRLCQHRQPARSWSVSRPTIDSWYRAFLSHRGNSKS